MGDLLVKVTPLAVGAMVSPTMFVALILILARPPTPIRRGVAFTACGTVPLLAVSVIVALIWRGASISDETGAPADGAEAWVDVAAGVALLVLGAVLVVRHRRQRNHPASKPKAASASPDEPPGRHAVLHAGLLGLGLMASNTSTLVLYIPAAKDIADSNASALVKLTGWVVLIGITMLPLVAALVAYAVAPGMAQRVLQPLGAWFNRHAFVFAMAIFVVLGLYLVARGGYHLLTP